MNVARLTLIFFVLFLASQRANGQCASNPTITGTFSDLCPGTPITYTTEPGMTNYTWILSGDGYIQSGQGTNSISAFWSTSGPQTISVNYTDGTNCTSNPTTENITVRTVPTVTVNGNSPVDVGSTNNLYSVSSGHTSYYWTIFTNPPGGPEPGQITAGNFTNTAAVTWNFIGNQIIFGGYFDSASGCFVSGYKLIEVGIPVPVISGPLSVCQNSTVFYYAQSGYSSYNWQVNGGSIISGAGTSTIGINWNTSGSQSVSLNFVAAGTQTTTTFENVIVHPTPSPPTISGSFSDICFDSFVSPEIYTTESGMNNYIWNTSMYGNIVSGSGSNSVSVVWLSQGPHTISVTYIDPNGCQSATTEKSVTMTSVSIPNATITGNTSVCPVGTSGNIYSTESGKSSYEWAFYSVSMNGNIPIITASPYAATITSGIGTNSITVTWNSPGIYLITTGYPDLISGCKSIGGLSVTVDDIKSQNISFSPIPTLTYGQGPVTLTAATFSGLPISFQSLDPNVGLVSGNLLTPIGAGTTTILASQGGNNCYSPAIDVGQTLTVLKADQTITFNSLPSICQSISSSLNATSSSGLPITYSSSNTSIASISGNILTTIGPGTAIITASQSGNANYKAASVTQLLTVNPLPDNTITPSGSTSICSGSSVTLSAVAGYSYLWSTGETSQTITVSASGSYSVTVTNSNGCSASSIPTVVNVNTLPVATITPGGATTFCSGGSVTLNSSPGSSYLWSTGATTQAITVSSAGAYSVTVTNVNGCSTSSAATSVIINPLPSATITPSGPTTFCNGSSVTLTANSASSYLWSNGATSQSINVSSNGNFTVTVTDSIGCTNSSSSPTIVVVNPLPTINIYPSNATICAGNIVNLTASGAVFYQWAPSTGLSPTNLALVTANPSSSITYTVTGTNGNGCTNSQSVQVNVNPKPTVTFSGPTSGCNYVNLIPSGANYYSWSGPQVSSTGKVTSSGYYFVTGTNLFGCSSSSSSQYIIINPNPTVSIYKSSGNICNGYVYATASATAGSTYSWPAAYPYPYSTSATVPVKAGQTRSVIVTKNGCSASASYYAGYCSGGGGSGGGGSGGGGGGGTPRIAADQEPKIPGIYPNPVDKELNIVLDTAVEVLSKIQLSDMSGRVLKVGSIDPGNIDATILMEDVPDGIYLLAVLSDSRKKYLKIIVKHNK